MTSFLSWVKFNLMKKTSLYIFLGLILIFSKPSYANDLLISDNGIKIGDSALTYFDKNFIESKKRLIYPKDDYFLIFVDGSQINIKNNDPNYTIASIDDGAFVKFDQCKNLLNNQIKKYKKLFPNVKQVKRGTFEDPIKHWSDPSKKSLLVGFDFYLNEHPSNGPAIRLECTNWSKEIETTKNYQDNFTKSINSKEFNLFLLSFNK